MYEPDEDSSKRSPSSYARVTPENQELFSTQENWQTRIPCRFANESPNYPLRVTQLVVQYLDGMRGSAQKLERSVALAKRPPSASVSRWLTGPPGAPEVVPVSHLSSSARIGELPMLPPVVAGGA